MKPPLCYCRIRSIYLCATATFVVAFFICTQSAYATTFIPFTFLTEDTVWNLAGSPYVIESIVTVNAGKTLTIEPGVIVKFKNNSSLNVSGRLDVNGTSTNKVYFTDYFDDEIGGDTNGDGNATTPFVTGDINIRSGGYTSFSYANVKYSEGIFLSSGSGNFDSVSMTESEHGVDVYQGVISVKNSLFSYIDSAVISGTSATVTLTDSLIENIFGGDDAITLYNNSLGILDKVTTRDMGLAAPVVVYDSTAKISNSHFEGGLESGMELYDSSFRTGLPRIEISSSTIRDFAETAIVMYNNSTLVARGVIIEDNGAGIELYDSNPLDGNSFLDISQSVLRDNLGYAIDSFGAGAIAKAENNWWGDSSGPFHLDNLDGLGEEIIGSVDFIPWLTSDPFEDPELPECCSSVAFVPGLQASRLYKQGTFFENKLWEPNRNADAEKLFLDENGVPVDSTIYTRDVIDEAFEFNVYKNFIEFMDGLVRDGTIAEWKSMPYDWRLKISDIVQNPVELADGEIYKIIDEIIGLAERSDTGKVTLIGHSNGGLVSKEIIRELERRGKANIIDKLILVAVPQLGTPKAIASLLHGDEQDLGFLGYPLNKQTARQLGENMFGAYPLLPSEKYFEEVSDPVIVFDPSVSNANSQLAGYGSSISTFQGLRNFLLGIEGDRTDPAPSDITTPNLLKRLFLDYGKDTHTDLDNWTPPANIKIIQIAGWGLDTIKGIEYRAEEICINPDDAFCLQKEYRLDRRPLITVDGDETVVVPSSVLDGVNNFYVNIRDHNEELFFDLRRNRTHKDILEVEQLQNFINNIIVGNNSLPLHVTNTKPIPTFEDKRIRLSVHSPVSLDVYDSFGNHTGPVMDPTTDLVKTEKEIPNSYYMEFGEGKYVGFGTFQKQSVELQGTGYGTFTVEVEKVEGDSVVQELAFKDLLVTPLMSGEIIFTSTTSDPILNIDVDNDGNSDFAVTAQGSFDPILYLEMIKKIILTLDLKQNVEKQLLQKADKAIQLIEKDKIAKVEEKIKKYVKHIDHKKPKKLAQDDKQVLIQMLTNLLDNLN